MLLKLSRQEMIHKQQANHFWTGSLKTQQKEGLLPRCMSQSARENNALLALRSTNDHLKSSSFRTVLGKVFQVSAHTEFVLLFRVLHETQDWS